MGDEDIPLLSGTELEDLVGPIALYPDDLLAIVLPAAAYPLQIVDAARFLEALEADPAAIEELARIYAASDPAALRCGWGQERNRNGGSATAAILALPAVAGKFAVRGGGYTLSNSGATDETLGALTAVKKIGARLIAITGIEDSAASSGTKGEKAYSSTVTGSRA